VFDPQTTKRTQPAPETAGADLKATAMQGIYATPKTQLVERIECDIDETQDVLRHPNLCHTMDMVVAPAGLTELQL